MLNCSATGDPPPRLTWRREDGEAIFENEVRGNV
ncbi:UNVERIFIED_CONTAM: hypothetical protein GTU68_047752 [Idotea baltica]|nr:hypothetical protein [Idotea baltica]